MNGQPLPFLTRPHLFAAIFFEILLFLLYLMARFLAPFFSALLWRRSSQLPLSRCIGAWSCPAKAMPGWQ
jgi:hypothetical protein